MLMRLRTTHFMQRGADIAFLSVYPTEREALYPPLTYLRSVGAQKEEFGDKTVMVVTVEPILM